MHNHPNESGKKRKGYLAAVFVLSAIFLCCIIFLICLFSSLNKAEDFYHDLQTTALETSGSEAVPSADSTVSTSETETVTDMEDPLLSLLPDKEISFQRLWELNLDIYAYVYIPNTNVDYPVLQHPTDDTFYLNHNADMTKGYPGTIYTELCNQKDFNDPVTLMYGHNMLNGSMFASLHYYEDPDFFEENRYVFLYTPYKTIIYDIFAAVTYSDEHIMKTYDFDKEEEVTNFLDNLHSTRDLNSHFREDIEITGDDSILVMSTCCNDSSKRFLVCAVKLGEIAD